MNVSNNSKDQLSTMLKKRIETRTSVSVVPGKHCDWWQHEIIRGFDAACTSSHRVRVDWKSAPVKKPGRPKKFANAEGAAAGAGAVGPPGAADAGSGSVGGCSVFHGCGPVADGSGSGSGEASGPKVSALDAAAATPSNVGPRRLHAVLSKLFSDLCIAVVALPRMPCNP